jgi:hypothetical protein
MMLSIHLIKPPVKINYRPPLPYFSLLLMIKNVRLKIKPKIASRSHGHSMQLACGRKE